MTKIFKEFHLIDFYDHFNEIFFYMRYSIYGSNAFQCSKQIKIFLVGKSEAVSGRRFYPLARALSLYHEMATYLHEIYLSAASEMRTWNTPKALDESNTDTVQKAVSPWCHSEMLENVVVAYLCVQLNHKNQPYQKGGGESATSFWRNERFSWEILFNKPPK